LARRLLEAESVVDLLVGMAGDVPTWGVGHVGQERVDTSDLRGVLGFEIDFAVFLADRVVAINGDLADRLAAPGDSITQANIFGEVEGDERGD